MQQNILQRSASSELLLDHINLRAHAAICDLRGRVAQYSAQPEVVFLLSHPTAKSFNKG